MKSKYSVVIKIDTDKNILFNTIYGSVDLLTDDMVEKWSEKEDALTEREREYLVKRGHIVSCEDEQCLINEIEKRHLSTDEKKSKFYIIFSYACNFGCFYCFENNIKSGDRISSDKLNAAFEAMKQIVDINKTQDNEIVLFGGEPLLLINRDLIIKTFSFARENGFKVSCITNGANVKEFIDIFEDYKEVISGFSITVDGDKSLHDSRRIFKNGAPSYNKIMEGINLLNLLGLQVSIRMNIDKTNGTNIEQAICDLTDNLTEKPNVCLSLVEDSNCNGGCSAMYNYFEATELLDSLGYFSQEIEEKFDINIKPIKQIKHLIFKELPFPRFKFCRMSELYVFSPNGAIYNCPQACDNNKMKVGEYWPNRIINKQNIYQRHGFSALKIPMCKDCSLAPICGGGCYAKRAYSFPQKICYKDKLMESLKYIFEKMLGISGNV